MIEGGRLDRGRALIRGNTVCTCKLMYLYTYHKIQVPGHLKQVNIYCYSPTLQRWIIDFNSVYQNSAELSQRQKRTFIWCWKGDYLHVYPLCLQTSRYSGYPKLEYPIRALQKTLFIGLVYLCTTLITILKKNKYSLFNIFCIYVKVWRVYILTQLI